MTLDPKAQLLLDKVAQSGIPSYERLPPKLARQLYEKACEGARGTPPELACVTDITLPGPAGDLMARCYRPREEGLLPVLVFFHGGGFTIGSPQSHDAVCRHLSARADCLVVSIAYRLAPEHRFPAALEDAYAATSWVAEHADRLGGDTARLAVAGDSAGGNLAAVTCLLAREAGFPQLRFQLLIYPSTDMTESFPSHRTFAEGYLLTRDLVRWFHGNYLTPDADPKNWRISPLHAPDHSGLPPAHVLTAGFDPLQDEGRAYAEKLRDAGVAVSYRHYPGMLHGFVTQPGYIDQAGEALTECGQKLREAFCPVQL